VDWRSVGVWSAGAGDADQGLPVSADLVARLRAGVLPRRRPRATQVRQDRLEHRLRLQRVRLQRLHGGAQDVPRQGV